jgi:hypothetical protein
MAGVDLRTIADLMGHSTIQITMRYAHLAPQHHLDASSVSGFQLAQELTQEKIMHSNRERLQRSKHLLE